MKDDWEKKFDENWNDASFTWNSSSQNGLTLAHNTRKSIKRFIRQLRRQAFEERDRELLEIVKKHCDDVTFELIRRRFHALDDDSKKV